MKMKIKEIDKINGEEIQGEDEVIYQTSKYILKIDFEKIFNNQGIESFDNFILKKKRAYADLSKLVCYYINYFIKHYDYDNELILGYLHMKVLIDSKNKYNKKSFINDLYETLLSDSMVEKIKRMTEDCYFINLNRCKKSYNESLVMTNEHGKILMNMSFATKMFIPLLTHYCYKVKIKNIDKFILKCYDGLSEIFQGEADIYNKLYRTVVSKINETKNSDNGFWLQSSVSGKDEFYYINDIVNDLFIRIIPKYEYAGNIVSFNHASIKNMRKYIFQHKFPLNNIPISFEKDSEGLSGYDKLELNSSKFDESMVILGDINAKQTIKKLARMNDIYFQKEEIDFYKNNLKLKLFQKDLIFQFFAKYFGSAKDLNRLKIGGMSKLIVIFKKMLERKGFDILQHILTGELLETINKKSLNKKMTNKIKNSPRFKNLKDNKYNHTLQILTNGEVIDGYLIIILNSKFGLVDYEASEYLGRELNMSNKDKISDEILRFIELI